jgi:hypothetical protein
MRKYHKELRERRVVVESSDEGDDFEEEGGEEGEDFDKEGGEKEDEEGEELRELKWVRQSAKKDTSMTLRIPVRWGGLTFTNTTSNSLLRLRGSHTPSSGRKIEVISL